MSNRRMMMFSFAGGVIPSGIVQRGLLLYVDAGISQSYPGTGTTWTDLTTPQENGTLVNGVGYSSADGGVLVFDGVNDYVDFLSTNLKFEGASQFTCSYWVKKQASTNCDSPIGAWNISTMKGWFAQWATDNTIYFGVTNGATVYNFVSLPWTNAYYNITYVYDGSQSLQVDRCKIYVNGVQKMVTNAGTIVSSVPSNGSNFRVGNLLNYTSFAKGNIPVAYLNDVALTASEITQNFNALKSRYGL